MRRDGRGGPTDRIRRATRWTSLAGVLLALAGCDGVLTAPGSLEVRVWLPADVPASIGVSGPGHYFQPVERTTVLFPLEPGVYVVGAFPVEAPGGTLVPNMESVSATVEIGDTKIVAINYRSRGDMSFEVSPSRLEMNGFLGGVARAELVLRNGGSANLDYELRGDSKWIAFEPASAGTLHGGQTAIVRAAATCQETGTFTGAVEALSNSWPTRVQVPLSLRCTAGPEPEIGPVPGSLALAGTTETPATGRLTLSNEGTADLEYEATSSAEWLTFTSRGSGRIAPGSKVKVGLAAECPAVGSFSSEITIASNDADEPTVTLTVGLHCTGVPDISEPEPSPLALEARDGDAMSGAFSFSNEGTAPLAFTVSSVTGWIALPGGSGGTLEPGASTSVALTARCEAPGSFSGLVTVESDDPDEPAKKLEVALACAPVEVTITELVATPAVILYGESSTLTWSVSGTGPIAVALFPDNVDLTNEQSWEVRPGDTTEYRLTASNYLGEQSATVTVRVRKADIGTPSPAAVNVEARFGQSVNATLAFANEGEADLEYEVAAGATWLTAQPTSGVALPSETVTLSLTATCGNTAGTFQTSATITTNDPDEPTISVPVSLCCRPPPQPDIGPRTPDPLQVAGSPGQTLAATVRFANIGELPLEFTVPPGVSWIVVTPTSGTVAPGAEQTLNLQITCPAAIGTATSQLYINSNDWDQPSVGLTVLATSTTTLDLSLPRAHLTQVSQNEAADVPLVAGWTALARAFAVPTESGIGNPIVRLHGSIGGVPLGTVDLLGPSTVPTTTPGNGPGGSFDGMVPEAWLQPGLEVVFELDPDNRFAELDETNNRFPTSGTLALDVREVPLWPITFVQVIRAGIPGDINPDNVEAWLSSARRYQPVKDVDVVFHAPLTIRTMDWYGLAERILDMSNIEATGRHYIAVVNSGSSYGIAGLGYIGLPACVAWDGEAREDVLAHEVGHNWNRRHAPCGSAPSADSGYPYSRASIGQWGYDRIDGTFKDPAAFVDYMSYCKPVWTSDYTFKHVLNFRLANPYVREPAAPEPVVLVRGRISDGRVELAPAFTFEAPPRPPDKGEWRAEGLGAAGELLFSADFQAHQLSDGGDQHFSFTLPLAPKDAARLARIRVVGQDGREAAELRARGDLPEAKPVLGRAGEGLAIDWDVSVWSAVLVRDAASGEVLGLEAETPVELAARRGAFEVLLSDGVRTRRYLLQAK
jgi:hypothetical protein